MSNTTVTKAKQTKSKRYMLVCYGRMSALGLFEHSELDIPKTPTQVVVKTTRGLELGRLVGQFGLYKAGQPRLTQDQLKEYFDDSGTDFSSQPEGKFIRYATAEDINEEKHLQQITKDEINCCKRFVKELDLSIKIVDAEHIFGGERIIFYFVSDGRVDFRDLVKKIAHEYQTRIEMRQIGSRDQAKLLGDVESCGQQCCCQRFLKALKPVNMRMAKMQKATLDPSKISGYCGRLKCCLRYEDQTYTELKKRLPKKNARVKTKHGEGKVISTQILTQLVVIEHDGGDKIAVPVEELQLISSDENKKTSNETSKDSENQNKQENKQKQSQ